MQRTTAPGATTQGGDRRQGADERSTGQLATIDDVELVEELSVLTTQTARMRARMSDIMEELERRRAAAPAGRSRARNRGRDQDLSRDRGWNRSRDAPGDG